MAASDARGRNDRALEQYVRQLLRDADRMRRATPPRIRPDAQTPLRPPPATDTPPPSIRPS